MLMKKMLRLLRGGPPKSITKVRSFHVLTTFLQCFVKDFSTPTAPLSDIIKKDVGFKSEKLKKIHLN